MGEGSAEVMNAETEPQSPTSTQSTKIWAWMGRIAVIVGLLWGIVQLSTWLWPNGPKLEAKCTEYDFTQAPDIEKTLKAIRSFPDTELLSFALTNAIESFETNLNIAHVVFTLERTISDTKSKDGNFDYNQWQHFASLTVRNNGNKNADQVVLPLNKDYAGLAQVAYDGKMKTEIAHGSLELGSLRPGGEILIKIWSVASLLPYGNDAVISHSGGTIPVQRPELLYGYGGKLGGLVNFFIDHTVLFITEIIVIGLLVNTVINKLFRQPNRKPTSDNVDNPPQNPQAS